MVGTVDLRPATVVLERLVLLRVAVVAEAVRATIQTERAVTARRDK
jgi:hypothetical protein